MPSDDARDGLLRSTGAATFSQVSRFAVSFGARIVLRRVVTDAAYGLWQWAVDSIYVLLAQLRDLGLPAEVVRSEKRLYGNFLAVEVIWGGLLAAGIWVAAPFVALGFTEPLPEVVPVLRLLAVFFFCEGLARVPLTFFEAELAIDRALVPEVVRTVCWGVVSIVLAFAGYGVWSMVVGQVVATALFAAMLWLRAWPRIPLTYESGQTVALIRLSLPLMLIALLYLSLSTVGFLIAGWRFDGSTVAHYGAAILLAFLVSRMLEMPIRRPLYPALVAVAGDRGRFVETYRLATVLLLALQVPVAAVLCLNAETILVLLFGESYAAAAPLLQVIAFAPLVQPFGRCGEDLLLTLGWERLLIVAFGSNLLCLGGLGLYLAGALGPVGIAWAHLLALGEGLLAWAVYRLSPAGFWRLLRELGVVYLPPVPLFAAALLLSGDSPALRLVLSTAAAGAAAAITAWRFGDEFVAYFRSAETAAG